MEATCDCGSTYYGEVSFQTSSPLEDKELFNTDMHEE